MIPENYITLFIFYAAFFLTIVASNLVALVVRLIMYVYEWLTEQVFPRIKGRRFANVDLSPSRGLVSLLNSSTTLIKK